MIESTNLAKLAIVQLYPRDLRIKDDSTSIKLRVLIRRLKLAAAKMLKLVD